MLQALKKTAHKVVGSLGYRITKDREPDPFVPHLESYSLDYGGRERCCFDFWLANRSGEQWYKEWFYQSPDPTWELREFAPLVQKGDRVLEIGCHHGFLTMMLSHCVGETGSIFAIDANPENVMIANAQIAVNGLGHRCAVKAYAGAAAPGKLKMEWRTNSHVVNAPSKNAASYEIEAITGDELDRRFGPFNVLKVDVEGFETEVLRGCSQLLKRNPTLLLELHPNFMKEYGYGASLDELWSLIGANQRTGTMVVRPHFDRSIPFDPKRVPTDEISNVHLAPTHEARHVAV
jgi:FkbM family methyltransferase